MMLFNLDAILELAQIVIFVIVGIFVLIGGYFWWNLITGSNDGN